MTIQEVKRNMKGYWLGPVVEIHTIGEYAFVEYQSERDNNESRFSIFIQGESISRSSNTIEGAMAAAAAFKFDGCNSQASGYFRRMIGNEVHKDYLNHCKHAQANNKE